MGTIRSRTLGGSVTVGHQVPVHLLYEMSGVGAFDAATDAIKCCSFSEEANFSQALRVLGNIGGVLGLDTLDLRIIFYKCG